MEPRLKTKNRKTWRTNFFPTMTGTQRVEPGIARVQARTRWHFAFAGMLSCAPIANPSNSAQVGGTPYHSPNLGRGSMSK